MLTNFGRAPALNKRQGVTDMAKSQKRSNREAKKPKQVKKPEAAPMVLSKGVTPPSGNPKKKG